MKKLLRKIALASVSLVISLTIFGTVTYAWFSLARTNILDNLTLNISTGDHLEISLDGINFYKELPSELIEEIIGDNSEFRDVTSLDGVSFYGGPLYKGEVRANIDYISLTFWFRTTDSDKRHIYLVDNISAEASYDNTLEGTYVVSQGRNWRSDVSFQYGPDEEDIINAGERNTYYGADAIRLSFIEEIDDTNLLDSRSTDNLIRIIFDPSGNPLRGFGKDYGAVAFYRVKILQELTLPDVIPETLYELTEFSSSNPYYPTNTNSKVVELMKTANKNSEGKLYYQGKLVFNVWLEGWDADCFNAIHTDRIKIQLKFKSGKEFLD